MNLLAIGTLFLGYLLVYAGIANHGAFASEPWAGLLGDAYTTGEMPPGALGPTGSDAEPSGPSSSRSPLRPRTPAAAGSFV